MSPRCGPGPSRSRAFTTCQRLTLNCTKYPCSIHMSCLGAALPTCRYKTEVDAAGPAGLPLPVPKQPPLPAGLPPPPPRPPPRPEGALLVATGEWPCLDGRPKRCRHQISAVLTCEHLPPACRSPAAAAAAPRAASWHCPAAAAPRAAPWRCPAAAAPWPATRGGPAATTTRATAWESAAATTAGTAAYSSSSRAAATATAACTAARRCGSGWCGVPSSAAHAAARHVRSSSQ